MKLDASEENSPGWKYAEWELRGVPLRLEIGPKDIEKAQVFSARRDTREKAAIPLADLATRVPALLAEIQANLLARARQFREEHTSEAANWAEFTAAMEGRPGIRDRGLVRHRGVRGRHQDRDAGDAAQHSDGVAAGRGRVRPLRRDGARPRLVRESLLRLSISSPARPAAQPPASARASPADAGAGG